MIRRAWRSKARQLGAIAVETALAIPIMTGAGLIGSDMHRIHTERIRLENATGAMGLTLSAQPLLTKPGLDALAEIAMQDHEGAQHLLVLLVNQSSEVIWALQRGGAENLCAAPVKEGRYTGSLPEDETSASSSANSSNSTVETRTMIVVQACRDTTDITLSGGLVLPEVLKTTSVYRAVRTTITLDQPLQKESTASGLVYTESEST